MSGKQIPNTAGQAIAKISDDLAIDKQVVEDVIDHFVSSILNCLRREVPFNIPRLGRFYHRYRPLGHMNPIKKEAKDIISRQAAFKFSRPARLELNGWVHDLGIKNNRRKELMKIRLIPSEIEKVRRKKTLEDQRKIGFDARLLFDDPPAVDKSIEKSIGESLTAEEIKKRIISLLDD